MIRLHTKQLCRGKGMEFSSETRPEHKGHDITICPWKEKHLHEDCTVSTMFREVASYLSFFFQ